MIASDLTSKEQFHPPPDLCHAHHSSNGQCCVNPTMKVEHLTLSTFSARQLIVLGKSSWFSFTRQTYFYCSELSRLYKFIDPANEIYKSM